MSGTDFVDFIGFAAARDKQAKKKVWNHQELPCKESWEPIDSMANEIDIFLKIYISYPLGFLCYCRCV
ncbi:hypothetical protein PAECIP111894_05431 [Paenibacillus pseudetheri]|uniref:Chromo domain-containing protein n=1 Tax=Paenibacillus pseudetheri TaxID=2897682 RepID=A0ABN8FTH7_9BACL|nr:hypothetical protein PAECIP111894_05431 [Paenibacillus pseudetheri]